jgi:hypothetical protein
LAFLVSADAWNFGGKIIEFYAATGEVSMERRPAASALASLQRFDGYEGGLLSALGMRRNETVWYGKNLLPRMIDRVFIPADTAAIKTPHVF